MSKLKVSKNTKKVDEMETVYKYDLANALHKLKQATKKPDKDLALMLGKSKKWICDKFTHLKIAKESHVDVTSIQTSKIVETRGLDVESKNKVLEKVKKENLTLQETRKEVQKVKDSKPKKDKIHVDVNSPKESQKVKKLKQRIKEIDLEIKSLQDEKKELENQLRNESLKNIDKLL